MKDGLDLALMYPGSIMRKGYSFLIANFGKTVALITLFIVALVSFTEISFSQLGSESFTTTLVMMLIASYVMYFSLEDAGEKLGRESDEYTESYKRYKAAKDKIDGNDICALRGFCLSFREMELEYRRSNALLSLGYTAEEYERYLSGEKLPKKAEKALRRVKKIKSAPLNAADLISQERTGKGELRNPDSSRIFRMLISLIPSTVCMLFTISVMISLKQNMSAASVIEAILKISTLPVIGLKGYSGGYEYATRDEKEWIEAKASLLESFLKAKQ